MTSNCAKTFQESSSDMNIHYIRTPCNFKECKRVSRKEVCQICISGYIVEVLWDCKNKCVLIRDNTSYHMTHGLIDNLTLRQVVVGLGFKHMETMWSPKGEDVLDMFVSQAPSSMIRVLDGSF